MYGARIAVFDVKPAHAIFWRFVDQKKKNQKPEKYSSLFLGTLPQRNRKISLITPYESTASGRWIEKELASKTRIQKNIRKICRPSSTIG